MSEPENSSAPAEETAAAPAPEDASSADAAAPAEDGAAAEDAAPAEDAPPPEPKNLVATLSDGTYVKQRIERQRACDEPSGKKICAGHLKRWYDYSDELVKMFGKNPEIYRCERCQILYRPNESETARTGTLAY